MIAALYTEDGIFAVGVVLGVTGWCLLWRAIFR